MDSISEKKIIFKENNRNSVLSDNYSIRYHACNRILIDNNIYKEISNLRRVFSLISSKTNDINLFSEAVNLLEKYILTYGNNIDFTKLDQKEINELFLDSCYDQQSFTREKFLKFVEHGADIFYKTEGYTSPFSYASRSSDIELLKEFLIRGASVNEELYENDKGTIWNFNHNTNFDKIKLFLEFGANINSQKSNGKTVLHEICECYSNTFEIVKYLIDNKSDVNLKDIYGKTVLHFASKNSNIDTLLLLLDKGVNINAIDSNGDTPLIIAAQSNMPITVKFLLDKGADKNIKNSQGKTAYELALTKEALKVAEVFDAENFFKDYQKTPEFAEINKIKDEILIKLKNGGKIESFHKEGSDHFEYDNGIYKYTSYDEHGDCFSLTYDTDEKAKDNLLWGFMYKEDLETLKSILKGL